MLSKQRGKVGVWNQVPTGRESSCNLTVYAQEVFLFADHMRSGQADQRFDVRERFTG